MEALLRLERVSKRFGGLLAVDGVEIEIQPGTISSLIGPNGAGKTTVFNLITGTYMPDEGIILFAGEEIGGLPPHTIAERGIARTFQTLRLFQNLGCLENVLSGRHVRTRAGVLGSIIRTPDQRREETDALRVADERLRQVGMESKRTRLAKNLAYGEQRRLEIARALATHPRLLILDEPAGGLNDAETEELMRLIYDIRDEGITVFLIEHDMGFVMEISDWVTVLDNGRKIGEGTPEQVQENTAVIEAYLGREGDDM